MGGMLELVVFVGVLVFVDEFDVVVVDDDELAVLDADGIGECVLVLLVVLFVVAADVVNSIMFQSRIFDV